MFVFLFISASMAVDWEREAVKLLRLFFNPGTLMSEFWT